METDHETIRCRQRAFGYSDEDLRFLITPMATDGQEAVGAMGTDTPLACLSDKPQSLFHYFKQLFAQVTNPPIDPIREDLVMSLTSYIGTERNILAETPRHCHTLKLPHPILTNRDLEKLRRVSWGDFLAYTLPMLYNVHGGEQELERSLETGGFRTTRQRRGVFEVVAESHDHPTADEVFTRARKRMPRHPEEGV